jgi:CRISPR-associated protein Cmr6
MTTRLRNSFNFITADSNLGLVLDRFLPDCDDENNNQGQSKDALFNKALNCKPASFYNLAFSRWKISVTGFSQEVAVQGRLISGMGIPSTTEVNIALHHTYGVPWLPGSGLKGLASHYCNTVWGEADNKFKINQEYHANMFGTSEKSGVLIFHDGWMVPDQKMVEMDVVTPHHKDYYEGKKVEGTEVPAPATDYDPPGPVPFLSVSRGKKFEVAVECPYYGEDPEQKEASKKWENLGLDCLLQALKSWGFGGKTNTGYGRLESTGFHYTKMYGSV